jgi:hypothetical protein
VHALQRAPERAFQGGLFGVELGGTTAALAVVGFRKVGEFEVNRESFGNTVSIFDGQARNPVARLSEQRIFEIWSCDLMEWTLAMLDKYAPQLFNDTEQGFPSLLDQDSAQ